MPLPLHRTNQCNWYGPTVVGYQQYTVANSKKMTTPTFLAVNAEGRKLGDYTPVSKAGATFGSGNFSLNFYNASSAPKKITTDTWIMENYETEIKAIKNYDKQNVVMAWLKNKSGVWGWYLACDRNFTAPMANYPLADGDGCLEIVTSVHGDGVTLTYSGSVTSEDIPLVVCNAKVITGNVLPTDVTLGQITPVSKAGATFGSGNFSLNFYNDSSAPKKITTDTWIMENYEAEIKAIKNYDKQNVVMAWLKNKSGVWGWYLACDRNFTAPMTDYPIKAGDGFLAIATSVHGTESGQGVELTFPTPLE